MTAELEELGKATSSPCSPQPMHGLPLVCLTLPQPLHAL